MSFEDLWFWDEAANIKEWLEYTAVIDALAFYLQIDNDDIIQALKARAVDGYTSFVIKKQSGNNRVINNPDFVLKRVQKRILNRIYEFSTSTAATGCVPGKSLKDNVVPHRKGETVIKMDIADAFPSAPIELMQKVLADLVEEKLENLERTYPLAFPLLNSQEKEILIDILLTLISKNRALPQGSPTSPYMFNLLFRDIDKKIATVLKGLPKSKYTRFVDDLTISFEAFEEDVDIQQIADSIVEEVSAICRAAGFHLNPDKTSVTTLSEPGDSVIITGIEKTYENKLKVPQHKLDKYISLIDLIGEIIKLIEQENYDQLRIRIELGELDVFGKQLGEIALLTDYENQGGLISKLQEQLLRVDSFNQYCTNIMGYVPRALNKAYRTLERNSRALWTGINHHQLPPSTPVEDTEYYGMVA